ncbi:RICIN domain-containing protein [Streptomyces monticola]|uniref:RICIN domain-containing protein n=1 Tax=Streptomyces monticola TaxID=2666263 RepID=A0ABW2JD88_9ACTN
MSVTAHGTYLIKNQKSGHYLTAKGASKQASADIVQEVLRDWPGRSCQAWRVEPGPAGHDTFRLENQLSGRYLQVRRLSTERGAAIEQAQLEENSPAYKGQTWRLSDTGRGLFQIVNLHSDLRLHIRDDKDTSGAPVDQWPESQGDSRGYQLWQLEPVEPRGMDTAFDALVGTAVEPTGNLLTALSTGVKATLETVGGVFGTVSRLVPGIDHTPFVRFSGFRGGEFIRFSQRHRVEAGPQRIMRRFPHLPEEFRDGFQFVMAAPRRSHHDYIGVGHERYIEFSDRRSGHPHPWDELFPPEIVKGEELSNLIAVVPAAHDDSRYLVFTRSGMLTIEGRLPLGTGHTPFVEPVSLDFLPGEFQEPDSVTSAVIGDEVHFFATKGDEFTVFTWEKVVQGPSSVLEAYPYLLGLWV